MRMDRDFYEDLKNKSYEEISDLLDGIYNGAFESGRHFREMECHKVKALNREEERVSRGEHEIFYTGGIGGGVLVTVFDEDIKFEYGSYYEFMSKWSVIRRDK